MTIAVTGATGALGTLVIDALLQRLPAGEIRALARNTAKAAPIAASGVAVREADYDRPETLATALDGVDRLLFISGNELGRRRPQHEAVIDAAAKAGVGRIVYTSILGADRGINPIAPDHVHTEAYLAASGVNHVVLRNGWYSENYFNVLQTAPASGVILTSAGSGRVASAARADYAEAAAIVLTADEPRPVYELSGDVAWTQDDLAAAIAEVTGADIRVQNVTADEHKQILVSSGLDEGTAAFIAAIDAAIAAGDLALASGELGALIGRPTTPLIDTLRAAR